MKANVKRKLRLRKYLFKRFDGHCVWCGTKTLWGPIDGSKEFIPPDYATIDLVVPKSKGGTGERRNLVLACRACNSDKGNKDLTEWLGHVRLQLQ